MKSKAFAAVLALCLFGQGTTAATLDVSGTPPAFLANATQVSTQFRNGQAGLSGAAEIYVAPDGDAGNGDPRAQGQFAWSLGTIINFTFSYDADGGFGGQGLLTATLDGVSAIFGDVVDEVIAAKMSFNALGITLEGPNANKETLFALDNLQINGADVVLGSFGSSVKEKNEFGVTGFGEVSDFVVTGTLMRSGTELRGRPSLAMTMGSVKGDTALKAVAPVPVPAAMPLLLLAFGSFAVMARRRRS